MFRSQIGSVDALSDIANFVFDNKDLDKESMRKAIEKIVDSTAAGDSFNSEILVGLLRKIPITDAINNGVNLAKKVIVGKGALVPSNV